MHDYELVQNGEVGIVYTRNFRNIRSHEQQIIDDVMHSLKKAGIPDRFHSQRLTGNPEPLSGSLLKWLTTTSRDHPHRGLVLVGGDTIEDLTVLTARGLHITHRSTRVMTLVRFTELLTAERTYLEERISDASCLCILGAGPRHDDTEPCFTHREKRRIEDRLGDWMAENNRLLIHTPKKGFGGWFSGDFVQRVAQATDTFEALK